MPTPTDNHNLDVGYVEGESWDYNDEFQTIEERLVVRDTEANLSNYTPHSAATFIATDTGAVYDGDGTNWNAATRSYATVDGSEIHTSRSLSDNRVQAITEANAIRQGAGVPSGEVAGLEPGVTAGLSDSGALSASGSITITSESDASTAASSGSGTESDPYIIENLDIDAGGGQAVEFHDPDATYYVTVRNCRFSNYGSYAVDIEGGNAALEDCESTGGGTFAGIGVFGGTAEISRTHIHGADGNAGILMTAGTATVKNSQLDDNGGTGSFPGNAAIRLGGGNLTVVHCDIQHNSSFGIERRDGYPLATVANTSFTGGGIAAATSQIGAFLPGTEIAFCRFTGQVGNAIELSGENGGPDRTSLSPAQEIHHCTFEDTPANNRTIVFRENSNSDWMAGWEIHHCKVTKTSGDQTAGNECIEFLGASEDCSIHHCWVTECPEDAYEFVNTISNVSVHHCVADNCAGEIVDFFHTQDRQGNEYSGTSALDVGSEVHHIYGESLNLDGVKSSGVDGLTVHDIHASAPNGYGVHLANNPEDCVVLGPLPLPENCGSGVLNTDVFGTSVAIYMDGEELSVVGSPPDDWTTIR